MALPASCSRAGAVGIFYDSMTQTSFPSEWTVFAPIPADDPLLSESLLTSTPKRLETSEGDIGPVEIRPIRGQASLQPFFGPPHEESSYGKAAYVFVPLRGTVGEEITLGFGGDYHLRVWFNGEAVYQSPEKGESRSAYPPSIRDHQATLRLRSGKNILAIRLLGGKGGAVLALGQAGEPDCRSILDDPILNDPAWTTPGLEALPGGKTCLDIGSRRELFVDDFLIDSRSGLLSLRLHHPVPREVVAVFGEAGEPWEGNAGYATLLEEEGRILLYYSGRPAPVADESPEQVTCLMESGDGIHFTRPRMRLVEHAGSKENNIIWRGTGSHNFVPFADSRPGVPPDQRYKAVGYHPDGGGLGAYASPDGRRWRLLAEHKILDSAVTGYGFDSQNLAFFDSVQGRYVCYFRNNLGGLRRIKRAVSDDFLHWTDEGEIRYEDARAEHLYINGIQPYARAPHLYLGTPARFVPFRKKVVSHASPGASDTVFMSSRDGRHFHRWAEGFLRPGFEPEVWTDRNNFCVPGFLQLRPEELSLYWIEHFKHPRPRIRRGTLRTDGFVSLHAPGDRVGEMLTRPLLVGGNRLEVNYATSAIGSLRFELCDEEGRALPGFSLAESSTLYGNEIAHHVRWRDSVSTLPDLRGKPIRLRIRMQDADLYSFRFTPEKLCI